MRISDWSSDVCSSDLTLKAVTKTLSSDAFGGRAPTTPAEERTIGYIAKQFAAAGLQPGNNGSWYQDVPLVEITPANDAALTVSGGANAALRFASRTDMVAATRRPVRNVEVKDADIVFAGYGINAPERGWNDSEIGRASCSERVCQYV